MTWVIDVLGSRRKARRRAMNVRLAEVGEGGAVVGVDEAREGLEADEVQEGVVRSWDETEDGQAESDADEVEERCDGVNEV